MDIEAIRSFCLALPHCTEDFPFDEDTLVFRVGGKIFAILPLLKLHEINLKCDPDKARDLREKYSFIRPGFHMNKKHWNTISFGSIPNHQIIQELIIHSYELVYEGLRTKVKSELSKK